MKNFDEDKIIDVLAVVAIFAFIFFMRWLMSVPRAYENNENENKENIGYQRRKP